MTTKKIIKELSNTLNEQIENVSKILNDNTRRQTTLFEQRAELESLGAAKGDIKSWLQEMIENVCDAYQKSHANPIKKLVNGDRKEAGELRNIFSSLSETPSYLFNGEVFPGSAGTDVGLLVFMLKQPILDNLDFIVDEITPENNMSVDEKERALFKVDSDLEKLEAEESELLESLKTDGLIDVSVTYDEFRVIANDQPAPCIDIPTEEEKKKVKITNADKVKITNADFDGETNTW